MPPTQTVPIPVVLRRRRLLREAGAVLRLASPVVAVQIGYVLPGVVDSMMLGRVSDLDLAAGALGASVFFGLTIVPLGVLMTVDALVSQAHGARDPVAIARALRQALGLALAMSIPVSAVMWRAEPLLLLLGQQPQVAASTAIYLRALVPGNPAFLAFLALRYTLQATGIVRPALIAIVLSNLANLAGNYALIFGHWGFPALGVVGSGWSTAISRWVLVASIAWSARRRLELYADTGGLGWLDLLRGSGSFLRLGLPIGLHLGVEIWLFNAVALLMGGLGPLELGGHQIALSLAATSFMVPVGIGGAAATRVGNAIGRGSGRDARLSATASLVLGGAVMSLSGLLFGLFPAALARLYTPSPEVIAVAVTLIPVAAVFQVFDGLQVVSGGVLRGAADTRVPALLALVGYWVVGLPVALVLAFRLGVGPPGLWWGLTTGLASAAALLLLRVRWRLRRPLEELRLATFSRREPVPPRLAVEPAVHVAPCPDFAAPSSLEIQGGPPAVASDDPDPASEENAAR